jgi:hypothetical protein
LPDLIISIRVRSLSPFQRAAYEHLRGAKLFFYFRKGAVHRPAPLQNDEEWRDGWLTGDFFQEKKENTQ